MKNRLALALVMSALGAAGLACMPLVAGQTAQAGSPCVPDETAGSAAPTEQTSAPAPEIPQPPTAYVVGRGDTLRISVEPDMSPIATQRCTRDDYTVGVDGKINFCQLGAITLEGLTERQIEEMIRTQFQTRQIYTQPSVTAHVTGFRSQKVYVNGAVQTPGEINLTGDRMTLFHAITAAGNFTSEAGPDVYVLRPRTPANSDETQPVTFDDPTSERFHYVRKDLLESFQDPPVRNGDTIWILKAEVFYINGEVNAPGSKIWEPCLNVGMAIAMASGTTARASLRRSYIDRPNARGGFDRIDVKPETLVQSRDIIYIRASLF